MHNRTLFGTWICLFAAVLPSFCHVHGTPLAGERHVLRRAYDYGVEDTTTEADYFHFVTRPDIRALKWDITVYDESTISPGYWFIAPYALLGQKQRGEAWIGPYIYDGKGDLIWSGAPLFDNFNIFDFRPTEIRGENMLTAIYKREDAGVILDNSYRIRQMVQWPGGHDSANMHEFTLFDDGTKALMLTASNQHLSGPSVRKLGHKGDCLVNADGLIELDITTSPPTTLFNWSFVDHLSLDETTYPTQLDVDKECREGWDAHHCNAIDRFENGDYLVSCRHTDALYKISRENGSILWRLGGTKSDFKFAKDAKFSRQHHARIVEQNETHTIISLFDNARAEGIKTATYDYTRGLILSLHDNSAEVVAEYPHPDHEWSTSRGSLEILPNGNVFMGWTFHSRISEHAPDGKLLMKAKLPPKKNTYRTYKSAWVGQPVDPPDVWAHTVESGSPSRYSTEIYVSWNGATEVAKWNMYRSNSKGRKEALLKSVQKNGFETFAKLDGWVRYVVAEAVDSEGNALGQSKAVRSIPPDRNSETFVEEQDWLEEHIPSDHDDHSNAGEGRPDLLHSDTPTQHESIETEDGLWDAARSFWQKRTILAFVGGFLACSIVVIFWWTGLCLKGKIRRKQEIQGYAKVNREDLDDDYELDEELLQANDDVDNTQRLQKQR